MKLPPYRVKESNRARRVRLQITGQAEVEVTIPRGFDRSRIPSLVEHQADWIRRTLDRVQLQRQQRGASTYPDQMCLRAIDRSWGVYYRTSAIPQVQRVQRSDHLELVGNVQEWSLCCQSLRHWLRQQAQVHLAAQLHQLSDQLQLPFQGLTLRSQKTRWGSCSSRHTISLNDQLLFLPPELVRYVLIHELCHTRYLNHSRQFWQLVNEYEPSTQTLAVQLRQARDYLPAWIDDC